jgi:O-antigen ligase
VTVALVAALVGFAPGLFDAFAAPKADAIATIGIASLAAWIVAAAWRRRTWSPLDLAVAVMVAACALSTARGISPRLSWLGELGQREGLRTILGLAGVYADSRAAHGSPSALRRTLDVALFACVLVSAYALVQVSGHDPIGWNVSRYPALTGVVRPASTIGSPTMLGSLLAAALALVCAQLALDRGDRAVRIPAATLIAVALLATLSRGAWIAGGAGAAFALAGAVLVRRQGAFARISVALSATLGPALAWGALALRAPLAARVSEGMGGESAPARIEIWRSAIALWRAHPWLGLGPDGLALMFPVTQTVAFWREQWLGLALQAHCAPLQLLVTCGVLTAIAGIGAAVLVARGCWRVAGSGGDRAEIALEAGAVIVALAFASLVNPIGLAGAALLAVIAGAMATLAQPHSPVPTGARSPAPTSLALAVGALVALLVAFPAMREWRALAAAARARDALSAMVAAPVEGRLAIARVAGETATTGMSLASGEDELARLACDSDLARSRTAQRLLEHDEALAAAHDAIAAARRATDLEPLRATNHQRLADALAWKGRLQPADFAVAEAEYRVAMQLAPMDGYVRLERARAELEAHLYENAEATAAQLVALYPRSAQAHALHAAALAALGRRAEALAAANRALAARWDEGSEPEHAATRALRRTLVAGGS